MGVGHLFWVPDTDDIKQEHKNHETIPSRFSLNRKQRSHLCPVYEVLTGIWNPKVSGQIVNSFGQGSVHLTVSLEISKIMPLETISQQAQIC